MLILLAGGTTTGCSRGIAWRGFAYEPVHKLSREENKLTFVYFRSWVLVACTEFEENVLKSPKILKATADLNCVVLDWYSVVDRPLAKKWGLTAAPAFAIVDPQGNLLAAGSGKTTLESLLESMAQAKQAFHGELPTELSP